MGWGGGWSESSFSPITNRHSSPCHTAPPSRVSPEFLVESAIKRRIFDNNCAGYLGGICSYYYYCEELRESGIFDSHSECILSMRIE